MKHFFLLLGIISLFYANLEGNSSPLSSESKNFISQGKPLAVHYFNFKSLQVSEEGVLANSETGDLLANAVPGEGDFRITARLRISNLGGTAAAFVLGRNYFGFDGKQSDIYLNGPLFGDEVVSLKKNSIFFKKDQWFDFEIVREDSTIRFLIDTREVYRVTSTGSFRGPMGFHPLRAQIVVQEFSASGFLIPVSLQAPGFDLPLIDLAHETKRQVVIDREKDQYLGHPTSVLLPDGQSLLMVYPKGHGGGPVVMKKSTDQGRSWSQRLPVPKSWTSSKEVPTLYPVTDRLGNRRILMFSGLDPIRMSLSENGGISWSELTPIFNFGGIVAMGDLIQLKNGDHMAFFHDDGRFFYGDHQINTRYGVYSTTSKDGGLSWGNPQIVVADPFFDLCEPGVVRSPDGNQIAMLLRENSRVYNSAVIFSDDEGHTWSQPRELPSALTGDRHQCLYAPDGRLVITFRDHAFQSPHQGDFVAWVGKYEDLVAGTEGQYRIRLLDNKSQWDCGYPAFEVFSDGTFFAASYGKWDADQTNYIMGTRFSLSEIDRKAQSLPSVRDVFEGGTEGYHTFRIPALWYTQAGVLCAFAEGRATQNDHAANDIVLKRSLDGGVSWLPLQIVAEQGDDCLNNPLIVEDQEQGQLILMYQKYPLGYHESGVGPGYDSDTICRSYIQFSQDQGASWSDPREITRMVKRPTWATSIAGGPGNGIQLQQEPYKNRLVMPFNQGPAGKWKVYAVYSDDGGINWTYGEVAFEKDPGYGNEVQMVELSDGSILMNSRSAKGKKLRKTAISKDGGENWTGLKDEPQLIESECMASIISLETDDTEIHPLIFSNPHSNQERRYGTLQVSLDDGTTWTTVTCVYNGSFAYSSLADMKEGGIGLLFEREDYRKISFLKTSLQWLLKKE